MHPVALPAGRPAYLWFQQWRILESGTNLDGTRVNYDGGTVEVADTTLGQRPGPAERLPWVNGPHDVITDLFGNPSGGRVSFSRDSHGYVASRLDLSRYAGDAISPQFTMNTDNDSLEQGWYLDDIRVYTCGGDPVPTATPSISGTPVVGGVLTADAGPVVAVGRVDARPVVRRRTVRRGRDRHVVRRPGRRPREADLGARHRHLR